MHFDGQLSRGDNSCCSRNNWQSVTGLMIAGILPCYVIMQIRLTQNKFAKWHHRSLSRNAFTFYLQLTLTLQQLCFTGRNLNQCLQYVHVKAILGNTTLVWPQYTEKVLLGIVNTIIKMRGRHTFMFTMGIVKTLNCKCISKPPANIWDEVKHVHRFWHLGAYIQIIINWPHFLKCI